MGEYEVQDADAFGVFGDWDGAETIEAIDHADACETFMEGVWGDWDYCKSADLVARRKGSDECVRLTVWAESTVVFRARVVESAPPSDQEGER